MKAGIANESQEPHFCGKWIESNCFGGSLSCHVSLAWRRCRLRGTDQFCGNTCRVCLCACPPCSSSAAKKEEAKVIQRKKRRLYRGRSEDYTEEEAMFIQRKKRRVALCLHVAEKLFFFFFFFFFFAAKVIQRKKQSNVLYLHVAVNNSLLHVQRAANQ